MKSGERPSQRRLLASESLDELLRRGDNRQGRRGMDAQTIAEFKNHIAGDVVAPDGAEYETLRHVFNRRGSPAVIVRPQSDEDIVTALRFAREQRFLVSIRSGGHLLT